MKRIFNNDWQEILADVLAGPDYAALRQFLIHEYRTQTIHPPMEAIFNALHYTSYADTKVVILGQDPYHGFNQAHGLSFSVLPPTPPPPSLVNIYKELHHDLGIPIAEHGFLKSWCDQGVLLLNTVLTVRHGQAHSHRNKGWEKFTDAIIKRLSEREQPMVFILWGRAAQQKRAFIAMHHGVLTAAHPSPLSAHNGFWGCRHFSRCNDFLVQWGQKPIDWRLPSH